MRTIAIAALLLVLVLPAAADFEVYELSEGVRGYDPTWPPDGSPWHGIHPPDIFCSYSAQTDHNDVDGDGQIDACESIQLDGVWRHVDWIGPTYTLEYVPVDPERPVYTIRVEPVPAPDRPPVPYEYHIVYPAESFCTTILTDTPLDQVCQYVFITWPPEFEGEWHVTEVETNIHVGTGSPVEQSTWSTIKGFFTGLLQD